MYNTKEELVEALTKIQRHLCAYDLGPTLRSEGGPASVCDCKYGANYIGSLSEEENGCPEMRWAVAIISAMSKYDMDRIMHRIQKKAQREYQLQSKKRKNSE